MKKTILLSTLLLAGLISCEKDTLNKEISEKSIVEDVSFKDKDIDGIGDEYGGEGIDVTFEDENVNFENSIEEESFNDKCKWTNKIKVKFKYHDDVIWTKYKYFNYNANTWKNTPRIHFGQSRSRTAKKTRINGVFYIKYKMIIPSIGNDTSGWLYKKVEPCHTKSTISTEHRDL